MSTANVRRVSGLETWFEFPGRTAPAAPRWKMFVVTAVLIFVLRLCLRVVLPRVALDVWLVPRVAFTVIAVTSLMTCSYSRGWPSCWRVGYTVRDEAARGTEQESWSSDLWRTYQPMLRHGMRDSFCPIWVTRLRSRRSRRSRGVAGWSSPTGPRPSFRDRTGSRCARPPPTPNHWLGYKTSSVAIWSGSGLARQLSSNGGLIQSDDAVWVPRHASSSFALNRAGSLMNTA